MKKINSKKGLALSVSKGFTLIELLVVVAIIGLLAAVVVAALGNANNRGKDSSIKTQLGSLRAQAELYSNGGSYATLFTGGNTWASSDTTVQAILTGIDKQSTIHTAGSSASAWAAQVQLKEDLTRYACMDNKGTLVIGTNVLTAGNTFCP